MRATLGGLVALACASPIITAIGSSIAKHNGSWSFLPAVWFVTLGVAIALLIAMLVLVIFEALVPSGTMPEPLYLIRGLRKRTRRIRRYSQISRILVRRGMLPYLRGTRRSELQTHDGRAQLAGSLRLVLEDGEVTFWCRSCATCSIVWSSMGTRRTAAGSRASSFKRRAPHPPVSAPYLASATV